MNHILEQPSQGEIEETEKQVVTRAGLKIRMWALETGKDEVGNQLAASFFTMIAVEDVKRGNKQQKINSLTSFKFMNQLS